MIHRTPIKVRFYELDPYKHLNHSVYIQYFEVGRIDLFAAFGWSLTEMDEMDTRIVVSEIATRFLGSAVERDELVVETWVHDVRRVSFTFKQRILRSGEVLVEQTVVGACTSGSGRPKRFPPELLAGIEPYYDRSTDS